MGTNCAAANFGRDSTPESVTNFDVTRSRFMKELYGIARRTGLSYRYGRRRPSRAVRANPALADRSRLAAFLKARRNALGLTQQLLADRLGVKASHVALLENGRRRPSLGLVVKLVTVLGVDGRELLELSYPEVSVLLSATAQRRMKVSRSWHRLLRNTALLSRYRVTGQELEVFEHLGMLGGKLTAKRFLAILLLVRDTP